MVAAAVPNLIARSLDDDGSDEGDASIEEHHDRPYIHEQEFARSRGQNM
jgi:hypothetical protein